MEAAPTAAVVGGGGRLETRIGTARLAREGTALWPAQSEEGGGRSGGGGGALLGHQWRMSRGNRQRRVREIEKTERARGGRALSLPFYSSREGEVVM